MSATNGRISSDILLTAVDERGSGIDHSVEYSNCSVR
jgi:hypothetical protein